MVTKGYKIPFETPLMQRIIPENPEAEGEAFNILNSEAEELLRKEAISLSANESGEYISSYFAVAKARSPGKFRPILNLKKFNKNIRKYKFKMESLRHVRDWLKEGAYCISIDLKDAFLHVSMHKRFTKFLKFKWLGVLYNWSSLPFGLRCSPRVLTKVLKPVMAFLRSKFNIMISIYLDDMLVQASSKDKALLHGKIVALVLMLLGWSVNWTKSNFVPQQKVVHLGFELDTVSMLVTCPRSKVEDLQSLSRKALDDTSITAHDCERLLGKMESVRPATKLAVLYY